jgi:hypothetical protein
MKRIFLISLVVALAACRPVSVIPPGNGGGIPGPEGGTAVSIALLKTLYNGAPLLLTGEYLVTGTVVSDDRQGNFYNTLVVDDGTGGIEIRMAVEEIFKRFQIHSRATVRTSGLWLGSYGGTLQLGAEPYDDYQTQLLSETAVAEHIFPDNEFYGEVIPRTLTFGELAQRYVSTYVAFERVHFADEEHGMGWAETEAAEGEELPSATDRHLVDTAGDTLIVRTSRHARFASWPLPEGVGRIEGVLGVFNGEYQLVVTNSQAFTPMED